MRFLSDKILFVLIVSLTLHTVHHAQSSDEGAIDSQFKLAVSLFDSRQYDLALGIFDKITSQYGYNSKTTASEFFKAKILFEQKNLEGMRKLLNGFIEKYPQSRYLDEIKILLIKYNLEVASYYNAFRESASLIDLTKSAEYRSKVKKIGAGIALNHLNEIQLQRVYDSFTNDEVKAFILLLMGKVLLKSGDSFGARSVFNELMSKYPGSEEYPEAKKLYDLPESSPDITASNIIIGVMLPLETGNPGEIASATSAEMLEGIKYALHEFNKSRDEKVGLLIRDTKVNADEIKKIIEEFSGYSSVRAVLGPIYSNEVRVVLQESASDDLPVISPTATDNDLTEKGENFFQANPSFSVRGRVMAQYLYYVENKRRISILNSIDGYSPLLAAIFTEEFEKLGGTVVRKETYKDGGFSFDEPIGRIAADSLTIEGIYIPLSNNSVVPMILTSLVKCVLSVPIYGNQDWLTAKGFETSPEISNNLTFTSDYFFDYQSDNYYEFNSEFSSVTGKDINRNVLYGYDAAKYLLTVIRNINPTRENIKAKIMSGLTINGYHNNISIEEERVNRFLNIVRYKDGIFQLVDKFRLSE